MSEPSSQDKSKLPATRQKSSAERKEIEKWQRRLLPWIIGMPTVLIAVFIYMASQQVTHFNKATAIKADSLLIGKILALPTDTSISQVLKNDRQYLQWITLAQLEQESMYRRYNQAGLLIMSRIFVKYLGFFTGMIMAIVGSVFIIGKLSEDYSEIGGNISEHARFQVVSSSPGIIFGVLGSLLMISSILQHNDVVVEDSPLFLNANGIISVNTANYFSKTPTKQKQIDITEAEFMYDSLQINK